MSRQSSAFVANKSQIFAAFFAMTCLLAGVQSYSLFERYEPPCSKNPIGWCLNSVDYNSSDMDFCAQAHRAIGCITHVLRVCYTRNDPELLQALSVIDLTTLYDKQTAICR